MRVTGDSSILPCKWLKTELPLLLDQIRMLVATSSLKSISDKTTTQHTVSMRLIVIKGCLDHTSVFLSLSHKYFLLVTTLPLTQSKSCEVPAEDAGKQVDPAETDSMVQLSRAEAKQAWLTAGGDTERAARQALRDRLTKVTNTSLYPV